MSEFWKQFTNYIQFKTLLQNGTWSKPYKIIKSLKTLIHFFGDDDDDSDKFNNWVL